MKIRILFLVLMVITVSLSNAQVLETRESTSGNNTIPTISESAQDYYDVGGKAEYFFGSRNSGQLMIKVNLWGKVSRPGLYEIPIKTDLVTLMSFAGGPIEKARLDNVKIIRSINGNEEVIKINVKKFLNTGRRDIIPNLQPGDTILVAGSAMYLFSTTVTYLTQIMTAINFFFFITNISDN